MKNQNLSWKVLETVLSHLKLLFDEFTLESKIRQNDENISFGYRSDRTFWSLTKPSEVFGGGGGGGEECQSCIMQNFCT